MKTTVSPKPRPRTIQTGLTMQGAYDAVASILKGRGYGVRMSGGRCEIYLRGQDTVLADGETWDEAVGKLLKEAKVL